MGHVAQGIDMLAAELVGECVVCSVDPEVRAMRSRRVEAGRSAERCRSERGRKARSYRRDKRVRLKTC